MARTVEQSYKNAEAAIADLKRLSLAATPRNIEVWYVHESGKNPALTEEIRRIIARGAGFSQAKADSLYEKYILRSDLSADVVELISRFEKEISEMIAAVETTGESAQGHGERLHSLSVEISANAKDNPKISALIESVVSVTKSIREENKLLEARLAESSDEVATLRHSVESIQREAMLDPLTGVKNRKTFDRDIVQHLAAAKSTGDPLALILADIDHFKSFNDRWGHQTGDQVLRLVAEVMNANVKGSDSLARFGGEEFAIILPETTLENASMLANRIRRAVEARRLKKRRTGEDLGIVTMSMGVAIATSDDDVESLIERADTCLYGAKDRGRNQVVCDDDAEFRSDAQNVVNIASR